MGVDVAIARATEAAGELDIRLADLGERYELAEWTPSQAVAHVRLVRR